MKNFSLQFRIAPFISVFFLLTLWFLICKAKFFPSFILPSPAQVLAALINLTRTGQIFQDSLISIYRIFSSFLLSVIISLPLGIGIGSHKKFASYCEPLIAFVRYMPPSAFVPLAIIWFGIGEGEKIFILILGIAPYLSLLIADAAAQIKPELVDSALTFGASKKEVLLKVVLPNSLPGVWDACRIMLGTAWTYVIIVEIVGASVGLGHLIINAQRFLKTEEIFAGILVIGFLGLIIDYTFKSFYKILFPWSEKYNNA